MSPQPPRDDVPVETQDDDEALTWGPASGDTSYLETSVDEEPAPVAFDDDDDDVLPEGVMSSTMLVVHGVFGGIYLLLTVAWLLSASRLTAPSLVGVPLVFWHLTTALSVAAPPLAFVGGLALTPLTPPRRRIVWFVVGILVLLPWPFIVGGVA